MKRLSFSFSPLFSSSCTIPVRWKRLHQSVCHSPEYRMSYSPQCPSLLNGWHSLTDERLFGVLGSLLVADGQARLHATTGRVSVPEPGRIFSGCTLLTCGFRVDMPQCTRSKTGNKDVFGRLRAFSPASCIVYTLPRFLSSAGFLCPLNSSDLRLTVCGSYRYNPIRSVATFANVRTSPGSKYRFCVPQNRQLCRRVAGHSGGQTVGQERRQTREEERGSKKPKSCTVCHSHAQKIARQQGIAGIFD